MLALDFHIRTLANKDWATLLFIIALILIAMVRTFFESRFTDYIKLLYSEKYVKVYKDSSFYMMSGFNLFLFLVNLLSVSFIVILILDHYHLGSKTDWMLFLRIFTLLAVFILSKYLFEKIIGVTFDIEELIDNFNLNKVSYRNYIGLVLLPLALFLYYGNYLTNTLIFVLITAVLIINILTYLLSLKNYQNLIIGKFYYFILYLCALEIAPYYFIYYLVTKN
jgi:hypothetical protein